MSRNLLATAKISYGGRLTIWWRSPHNLLTTAKRYTESSSLSLTEGSLWSKGRGSGWMWMLGDSESYYSMRIWVQTYVCAHAHGGVCMYNIRSFALLIALKCERLLKSQLFWNFFLEIFGGMENSWYFCTRFWEIHFSLAIKKEFFERFYINRQVVQEAVNFL